MWLCPVSILLFYKSPSPTLLAKEDPAVYLQTEHLQICLGSSWLSKCLITCTGAALEFIIVAMSYLWLRLESGDVAYHSASSKVAPPRHIQQGGARHKLHTHSLTTPATVTFESTCLNCSLLLPMKCQGLFMWQEFLWISPWSSQSWALFMQQGWEGGHTISTHILALQ